MIFSSTLFLWIFFPITFVIHYFIDRKYANGFLLLASLIFYAWGEPRFVLLMVISICLNWLIGLAIGNGKRYRGKFLFVGIVLNLMILGYFKYANFFVRIVNSAAKREMITLAEIALPVGISFFTFQAISYIIDVYRGEVEAQKKWINVALYISFFPQLIAGPIVKYKDINRQIENREITSVRVAEGFRRFIYGLSKKVLISNVLGETADAIFALEIKEISSPMAWIAALTYTFQIYYDFSGYSDMAIGLGKMFGFDILENFNYPYLSRSIREFWRRWHISLSTWFKEYLYIPLGGNKKGQLRTYINLFLVFLCTGLWHGASYNFIVWGLYHGFFSILERLGLGKLLKRVRPVSRIYTLLVVCSGWILFRVEELGAALAIIKRMFLPWRYRYSDIPIWTIVDRQVIFIFICAVLGMGILQSAPESWHTRWKFSILEGIYCTILLILSIAFIASGTYNPFIYFKF